MIDVDVDDEAQVRQALEHMIAFAARSQDSDGAADNTGRRTRMAIDQALVACRDSGDVELGLAISALAALAAIGQLQVRVMLRILQEALRHCLESGTVAAKLELIEARYIREGVVPPRRTPGTPGE